MNCLVKKLASPSLFQNGHRYKSMKCKLTKPNPTSCDPKEVKICPEKPCPPPPPCRVEEATHMRAYRVVCCPPPYAYRPPCPPVPPLCPITCDHRNMFSGRIHEKRNKSTFGKQSTEGCDLCPENIKHCGLQQTEVSIRLEKADEFRRLQYEEDVLRRRARKDKFPPKPNYQMECYKPCVKTTDGKEYVVESGNLDPNCECGSRTPLCLRNKSECMAKPSRYIDHCKHAPKTVLEILPRPPPVKAVSKPRCVSKEDTRGPCVSCSEPIPPKYSCTNDASIDLSSSKSKKPLSKCDPPQSTCKPNPCKPCKPEPERSQPPGPSSTSKAPSSSGSGAGCPRSCPEKQDWCSNKPSFNKSPDKCREPTTKESLFNRKNKGCERTDGDKRKYHTLARCHSAPSASHQHQSHLNICYSCSDILMIRNNDQNEVAAQMTQNRYMSISAWRKLINLIASDDHSHIPKERNLCVPKQKPKASKDNATCKTEKGISRVEQANPCAFYKHTGEENYCIKKADSASTCSCQCSEKVQPIRKQVDSHQCSTACDLKAACREPNPCCSQKTAAIPQVKKPECNSKFTLNSSKSQSTTKRENIGGIRKAKSTSFCSGNKPSPNEPAPSSCFKKS